MPPVRKFAVPLLAACLLTVADQWSKAWIVRRFSLHEARAVIDDYFHIVHVRNRGVAFGFLSTLDPAWVNPLLLVATALAVAAVLAYIYHLPGRGPAPCGLGLILGGAIGNLIDRGRLGYVVDFLDVHWRHLHWPAFNLADIGITVGILLLILDMIFWGKEIESASRPR
ncbi:MAG: signal peptidase II [Deltaproteobacteria bacterium]|nr:signal peptidase II [Candidatus Deferrimicrobiaceae bacterium]